MLEQARVGRTRVKSDGRNTRTATCPQPRVRFVAEQKGPKEDELKAAVILRWLERGDAQRMRAYLAQVAYPLRNVRSIALCIASDRGPDERLIEDASAVFHGMFERGEHLHMFFVSEQQEKRLRQVCCPFFSSARFEVPDFWMSTTDGIPLEEPRACYKVRRLTGSNSDGYLLCEIDPPFIGQRYGLGGRDIDRVMMAVRHRGRSLFPIGEWPAYVHVARLTVEIGDHQFVVERNDFKSMIWAELYDSRFAHLPGADPDKKVIM